MAFDDEESEPVEPLSNDAVRTGLSQAVAANKMERVREIISQQVAYELSQIPTPVNAVASLQAELATSRFQIAALAHTQQWQHTKMSNHEVQNAKLAVLLQPAETISAQHEFLN